MILSGLTKSTTIYSYGLYSCFRHNFVRQTNTHWVAFGEPLLSFQNASAEARTSSKSVRWWKRIPNGLSKRKMPLGKVKITRPIQYYTQSGPIRSFLEKYHYVIVHKRNFWGLPTVFENHRKGLIQHCERSEQRLHFEWTYWSLFENAKISSF